MRSSALNKLYAFLSDFDSVSNGGCQLSNWQQSPFLSSCGVLLRLGSRFDSGLVGGKFFLSVVSRNIVHICVWCACIFSWGLRRALPSTKSAGKQSWFYRVIRSGPQSAGTSGRCGNPLFLPLDHEPYRRVWSQLLIRCSICHCQRNECRPGREFLHEPCDLRDDRGHYCVL